MYLITDACELLKVCLCLCVCLSVSLCLSVCLCLVQIDHVVSASPRLTSSSPPFTSSSSPPSLLLLFCSRVALSLIILLLILLPTFSLFPSSVLPSPHMLTPPNVFPRPHLFLPPPRWCVPDNIARRSWSPVEIPLSSLRHRHTCIVWIGMDRGLSPHA